MIHLANDIEHVRRQAARRSPSDGAHGMNAEQISQLHSKMDAFMPKLAGSNPVDQRRAMFQNDLPAGANWDTRRYASGLGGMGTYGPSTQGGGSYNSLQRPYQPEYDSPDRQQYPVHRILANRYWRLFFKLDPVIGTGIDMYAEMPWGDVKLVGEGVDGTVRETFEGMWEICQIPQVLPTMVREFLVVGEVVPHCFFSDEDGIWTYVAFHNPDNLEVIDSSLLPMQPVVEFIPDDKLRQILVSNDPELAEIRSRMPPELLARLYSRQNIRLNTDLNATFIPRKLHPYETRGTSLLSRVWRIFMYEDAIFNASIATARRHAGPIKVAKLGNAATNWIPGPEHERRFIELISQAEMDPLAWIVFHYGLTLEAFGTTDRVMTINREWDIIERIKLVALGMSRSFLTGELTFASASAGLQVFLRRLLSIRNFFSEAWIRSRFFKPISQINGFVKPTAAELSHRVRKRRTASELTEDRRYIVPKLDWANKLNPLVDKDLLDAYDKLGKMGFRISKTKMGSAANLGFEEELKKGVEEDAFENEYRKRFGVEDEKADPEELKKVEDATDPDKEKKEPAPPPAPAAPPNPRMEVEASDDEGISDGDVEDLLDVADTGDTQNLFWAPLLAGGDSDIVRFIDANDIDGAADTLDEFLDVQGISTDVRAGIVKRFTDHFAGDALPRIEAAVDRGESIADEDLSALVSGAIRSARSGSIVRQRSRKVKT